MPWKYNGTNIKEGRSWTSSDNVVHPSNWGIWSDDYKKSVGLTFEAEVDNSFETIPDIGTNLIKKVIIPHIIIPAHIIFLYPI